MGSYKNKRHHNNDHRHVFRRRRKSTQSITKSTEQEPGTEVSASEVHVEQTENNTEGNRETKQETPMETNTDTIGQVGEAEGATREAPETPMDTRGGRRSYPCSTNGWGVN
jgi:hypothetical protein